MVWSLLQLGAALVVLALGAELLVRGASELARRCGVSSFFIGITIVGLGTSTPELFTSVVAGLRGFDDIAVGNVVGSNTFNIALTLGLSAALRPIAVKIRVLKIEVWIVIAAALVPFLSLLNGGWIGRPLGAMMLVALGLYLWRGYRLGRNDVAEPVLAGRTHRAPVIVALVLAGLAGLVCGSQLLIDSATALALALRLPDLVIGLTIVAAGTSAPELVTSLVAMWRRQSDIAVGNVLGSNVFNMLGILGITSLCQPQLVKTQVVALDAPVMLLASLALMPIARSASRISRPEGILLSLGYVAYVWMLIELAPRWFPAC